MLDMFRMIWYWFEVMYSRLLNLLGVVRSTEPIPKGMYCYEYDEKRNAEEPLKDGYYTKVCKYYRSTNKNGGVACTYEGFIGFDPCLYDQCKICGIKEDYGKDG
jgi:hypothetical protein